MMNMKRQILLLISIVVVATGFLLLHRYANHIDRAFLPGVTTEDTFAGVVVPADENQNLLYDVKGFVSENQITLFLPCRMDASNVVYYSVDQDGKYLERFQNDFLKTPGLILDIPVVAMQSELPTMELSVQDKYGTLEDVESSADHSVYAYGDMILEARDDVAKSMGIDSVTKSRDQKKGTPGSMSFRGRGNITWLEDKKPYALKLEQEMDLLGMGESRNWVLLANAADYSLLRNEVFYNLAQDMNMPYAPQIEQIDLFINGEYRGTYSLCTKVEIASNRVSIKRDRDFLFRFGLPGGENTFAIQSTSYEDEETKVAEVCDSKDEQAAKNAKPLAQRFIDEIEDINSNSIQDFIDLTGFAKYYWIQEFAKNTDATARSFYTCYIADAGKMKIGPVWDMDRTAGVIEPYLREYDYLYPTEFAVRHEDWFVPLFEHPEFAEEVNRVYREDGINQAFQKAVEELPDRIAHIRSSANMNFVRWKVLDVPQNNKIVSLMGNSSYDAQTGWLTEWLKQRAEWIEEEMSKTGK